MRSTGGAESAAPLRVGALTGALFGAVDAYWALPGVEHPLLSATEWWTTWFSALALGAFGGLLVGGFVALFARGRGGRWSRKWFRTPN